MGRGADSEERRRVLVARLVELRGRRALSDTLVAPCVTIDSAITVLRGAQAAFLLDGTLLGIDPDAYAVDHQSHAGAPATSATATMLSSYPAPHLAAVGALACATRANPDQIAALTLASVIRVDASFTSGHRITPPFRSLVEAQTLARRAAQPLSSTRANRCHPSAHPQERELRSPLGPSFNAR